MITSLFLALASLAAPQQERAPQWQRIDGVAMHVGDRIVTFKELEAAVLGSPAYQENLSNEKFAELTANVLRALANQTLELQAGEDEGLDPARIRQIARDQTRESVNKLGAALFSDQLRAEGARIEDLDQQQSDRLYSQAWRSKQTGTNLGFTERPSRDRYIRPGMLKSIFRVSKDMLNPGTVELRFFVLNAAAVGSDQDAINWLEGIKQRVAGGEDFASIVTSEASEGRANGGLQPEMAIPRIAFPELRDFAATGQVGEFAPIVSLPGKEANLFLLARLESRRDQEPPSFEDGDLQSNFRRQIRNSVDNRLIDAAHERLYRRSHLWVHPDLAGLRRAAKP